MSANVYSISTLLEGKLYRSQNRIGLEGIIQEAEPSPHCIHYDGAEAYLIRVRPTYSLGSLKPDFYATVAVKVGE